MKIEVVHNNKKRFSDLLILADEQEDMIDKYLERGELFALYDGSLKSVCVVTEESSDTCELKNIATYVEYQKQGYATKLIDYISNFYKNKYITMFVGTGDVPHILHFYEKCGFTVSHRVQNFFLDNYDHPMFENGIQLKDMVYLRKEL